MPNIACDHKGSRQGHYFRGGNRSIEDVVQIIQVPRVRTKIGHCMRIGDDEARGPADDCQSGYPMVPFCQLSGEQPNGFLIVEKVSWQGPPGCLSIRWWIV